MLGKEWRGGAADDRPVRLIPYTPAKSIGPVPSSQMTMPPMHAEGHIMSTSIWGTEPDAA